MSHKKFGPDRFSRFDVYWIQTNKQTDRQAKFIDRWTGLAEAVFILKLAGEFFLRILVFHGLSFFIFTGIYIIY